MQASQLLPAHVDEVEIDGAVIRKGTVGAFLFNARTLSDPRASAEARAQAQRDIADALPALRALGLFEVFDIRDPSLRAFVVAH